MFACMLGVLPPGNIKGHIRFRCWLVTVQARGDFIALPHWELRPTTTPWTQYWHNRPLGYIRDKNNYLAHSTMIIKQQILKVAWSDQIYISQNENTYLHLNLCTQVKY